MDGNEFLYFRLVDGLRLAASTFKVQREVLPDFVHLPDEVLDAVDFALVPQLTKAGMISEIQTQGFRDYDAYLNTWEAAENYEDELMQLETGSWFQELRERALALLELLGEQHDKPTLDGVKYVKGAQPDAAEDA